MKKNTANCYKLLMRLSTFYIVITLGLHSLFATEMKGQALRETEIVLDKTSYELEELFRVIEKETAYRFIVSKDKLNLGASVTVLDTKTNLLNLLEQLSKEEKLRFYRVNDLISVSRIKKYPIKKQIQVFEQITIKGQVVDSEGVPLPGATVQVNDGAGVVTDFNGDFSVQGKKGDLLTITYIGFLQQTVTVDDRNFYEITLTQDVSELDEVVVTALGIKREEKKLGFSQETVKSEQLSQAIPVNWSSGLKGKVAGLNIVSSGSGPINSQQIILRGNSSFDLNGNYALVVVDGVPVNTEMTTSGSSSSYLGEGSPIDYGNAISDLNLDDIESVSVLKGPGAAALYGSRAANGVLMITTKSGKNSTGLGITLNTSTAFDVIQRWPDWQHKYGQGTGKYFDDEGNPYYSYGRSEDGGNTGSTSSAWGPEFNGQNYYQYDPTLEGQGTERTLWRPYEDNRKDFWRTGITTINDISIQGGGEKGSMRASIGHTKNEWVMPNTGFERLAASVNSNYKISDKIDLGAVINYTNRTSDNLPSTGYNNGSIAYFMIFQNPNVDLDWLRPIWQQGQEDIAQIQPFSSYIDNPYLIAYESLNTLESNQIVGNINTNIHFSKSLNLLLRTSLNTYHQDREQKRPYSVNRYGEGYYGTQDIFKQEINNDFLLTYTKKFSKNFDVKASVGGNNRVVKRRSTNASVTGLVVPGVYKLANGKNTPSISTSDSNKEVNSLYGLATFSFKDQIFVDVTGRNDWSSTLPKDNWSFFYPSVNTSIILSDMFNWESKTLNFLKYRFSYAEVGNDTDPYQTSKYYNNSDFSASATVPSTLYNANLKPEISKSFETGIEARMFDGRVNLDATVYEITTDNQVIQLALDRNTGYSSVFVNSGAVRNRGIELTLDTKIFNSKKFQWNSTLTWSKNEGRVFDLPDEVDNEFRIDEGGNAYMIAKVGGSPTAIYGYGFVRSPDGEIVYDDAGLPAYPESGDFQYIGDALPDWRAGWYNQFKFGNFTAGFTFDGQYGGIIYSQTHHKLTQQGKLTSTYYGRDTGFIVGDGVVDNGDGTYSPNTTEVVTPDWYNRYYRRANVESNSFDASYIKLREVRLQYSLPRVWLQDMFLQGVDLSIYGSNLLTISDFPIYDPETAALNGNRIMPGVEMGQMPSPATYGFNVKLKL
ncbi:SusC/RagA family TonB-linked outer membrane protein [Galbibacter mesophilus]|uniref:SusC/RagA family TonB-linked outer membrane protein n=1 Tax=Galbibacter mesophilus TaxID=379069 RepID=UPI00191D2E02|nr:SusC/RagA family TonB-linked outer membrane protein [Galbibacter mesophilus]MCM5663051.1 SusC/RagA family TonB-linked outer membrane protein [Galbibacter mesophilus]